MEKKVFTSKELGGYLRFEKDIKELSAYANGAEEYECKSFEVTYDDMKSALEHMMNGDIDLYDCLIWMDLFPQLFASKHLPSIINKQPLYCNGSWNQQAIFIFNNCKDAYYKAEMTSEAEDTEYDISDAKFIKIIKNIAKELLDDLETFENDDEKKLRSTLSKIRKEVILENYDKKNNLDVNSMSSDELKVYKSIVEEYAAMKDPRALQLLSYDYYGGNNAQPCDYYKSRDLMLELIKLDPDKTGQWANTLGYIYYYGRCNEGNPQYEEALKYFTLGEIYGYYESTYKLADMYMKGLGVTKDERAAFRLTERYYNDNFEAFMSGSDNQKLADLALRMGDMTMCGRGTRKDVNSAYFYFQVADIAIRQRMKETDFFGDKKVYESIQSRLAKCRSLVKFNKRTVITTDMPIGIYSALEDDYNVLVSIKELKNEFKITSKRIPKRSQRRGMRAAKIMIASVPDDYLEILDEVVEYVKKPCIIETENNASEFVIDNYSTNDDTGETCLYMLGKKLAVIRANTFRYKLR